MSWTVDGFCDQPPGVGARRVHRRIHEYRLFMGFMARLIVDSGQKVFLILDNLKVKVHHVKLITAWQGKRKVRIEINFHSPAVLARNQSRISTGTSRPNCVLPTVPPANRRCYTRRPPPCSAWSRRRSGFKHSASICRHSQLFDGGVNNNDRRSVFH